MKPATWIVFIAAALLCSGCAAPVLMSYSNPAAKDASGVAYYLPKRLLRIQVDRTPAPTAKLVEKAKADLAAAEDAQTKAAGVSEEMNGLRDQIAKDSGTTSKAYLDQAALAVTAAANLSIATTAAEEAKKALKTAMANDFLANKGKPPLVDTLTLTLTAPVADTGERFVAKSGHVPSRTDSLVLKTNTSGLLSNSDATVEDQTAAIIVSLAGAIAAVNAPMAAIQGRENAPAKSKGTCGIYAEPPAEPSPFSVEFVVDPSDIPKTVTEHSDIDLKLCSLGADYRFVLNRVYSKVPKETKETKADSKPEDKADGKAEDKGGLYYRREIPYLLSIFRMDEDKPRLAKGILLAMPNGSPREFLPMEGGEFTTRTFATVFDNGMLVSHSETKPSELLAVAKIPVDVLKAIFSIPTELITLKVNYTNANADLAGAQKAVLDAARALEDARKQPEVK